MKALDIESADPPESKFSDISKDHWYYSYVVTAEKLGIVSGFPGGLFKPNDNILRQDIAVMTVRALQVAGISIEDKGFRRKFEDEDEIADYATAAVETLVGAGILTGYENGEFLPRNFATRAEAAKIIYLLR